MRSSHRIGTAALSLAAWLPAAGPAEADLAEAVTVSEDENGLLGWEWHRAGVTIRLIQRLPDQTRAFFQARGFAPAIAEHLAMACVFQAVYRNDGDLPVSYDLGEWRVQHRQQTLGLHTREYWEQLWSAEEVEQGPRIALRWSLLPTRQRFEPGDYNWGMTSFGLAPGSRFDLTMTLRHGDQPLQVRVTGMQCAPDL